ncbi:MAG: bacillithiol biosynthesis deacetylase BshB1 [Thermoanaerobaculia bacterium]|nr:bacillithiol biosynthesis deacetylase BshB1 [Thermoanaerobaculia bacterium]
MSGLDLVAVGAHPDDVELGCGGTLALAVSQGLAAGIVHLTSGEAGTRGTPERRRAEAAAAAEALGVGELAFLDCGDGGLRRGPEEEDALIELFRRWRPEVVLGPPVDDRHPDHRRAHALVRDAFFYAGLAKRRPDVGAAHRPGAHFHYLAHDLQVPTFIVDVTSVWARKMAALDAYESQLHRAGQEAVAEPPTKVSSREFRRAVEGRARELGMVIGVPYGEGFTANGPLAVSRPWELVTGGVR